MEEQLKESKILNKREAFKGKWLGFYYLDYSIGSKTVKNYESIERLTRKIDNKVDGVTIIPILKFPKTKKVSKLVCIAQFRAPAGKFILEFPAGLCDGSNIEEDAFRELKEETGFTGIFFYNTIISWFFLIIFHFILWNNEI